MILSCLCYVDHGDLPVLTHSFPTRRSSDRTQVTYEKADVAGFKLSPDGTRLLVWGDVPRECTSFGCDAKDKGELVGPGSGRIYKDGVGFVRHWGQWEKPGSYSRPLDRKSTRMNSSQECAPLRPSFA